MPAEGVKAAPKYKNDPAENPEYVTAKPYPVLRILGGVILIFRCGLHSLGHSGNTLVLMGISKALFEGARSVGVVFIFKFS